MSPTPRSPLARRRAALVVSLLTLSVLSACGVEGGEQQVTSTRKDFDIIGSDVEQTTTPQTTTTTAPPTDVDIQGTDGSELNDVIGNAVTDLEEWWTDAYPEAYGTAYEPLAGGLYAIDSSTKPRQVPCGGGADDISQLLDNAYYCPPEDAVVWDQQRFMPQMEEQFGSFTVAMVVAHEWGHVIQNRTQYQEASVTTELQADCFAGAWVKRVSDGDSPRFTATTDDLDVAISGVLSLRDAPGAFADDPAAHGSGFDRVSAFQEGFESGVTRCAEFTDGDPAPYQFPFSDQAEADSGGDLHLSGPTDDPGIIELSFPSLAAFWADTFPTLSGGEEWTPLEEPIAFSADSPPECAGDPAEGYLLFVCIPDRYVGFEIDETVPTVYEDGGDFAVATLFATQYGLDVTDQLGSADDEVSASLQADCFAGAWAAALLPPDPPEDYQLVLSPGDLDEGVGVLLTFRSDADRERQGPGFDRIRAYRAGVLRGAEACLDISAN